ncbi:hypothetical protein [Cognatiluteimonas weifangensis]|uniref:hypothetical protein n=1 Tax=Cognatiluteimonas weifangensis TaxID=2303539 RepID=UPI0011C19CE5|nr:hypothetical protein [Luteimonas weifangensis]
MTTKSSRDVVEEYRRELIEEADSRPITESWEDYPPFGKPRQNALSDLEHAWRAIAAGAGAPMLPVLSEFRRFQMEELGDHPLAAMSVFVDAGHYPPPELLLAVLRMYRTYLEAEGQSDDGGVFFWQAQT